ncbi:hypothetical protein EON77_18530, partial [bacterium]
MKIPREAMTPALDAAIRAFVGDGLWFRIRETSGRPAGPEPARDLLAAYATGKAWVALGWTGVFLVVTILGVALLAGGSPFLFLIPLLLVLVMTVWLSRHHSLRPDGLTPTPEFLGAALAHI